MPPDAEAIEIMRMIREMLALDWCYGLALETPDKADGYPPKPRDTWICFYTVEYPNGERDANYHDGATALEAVRAVYEDITVGCR